MRIVLGLLFMIWASVAQAVPAGTVFSNIDGGNHRFDQWKGQPVLVVNTASQCGFTYQYEGLQALHERYGARGLVVLAVPSDDFKQELDSAVEVKEFCTLNFGLNLPMTDITHLKGAQAHPFYGWVAEQTGFVPAWNFNKVLIGPDGNIEATWGSNTRPLSRSVTRAIEAVLN